MRLPGLPPLVAGAIGYFSYDMVRLIERLPKRMRDEIGNYDAALMFYHGIVVFDHVQHRLWVVRNVFTEGPGSLRGKYNAAVREIKRTRGLLQQPAARGTGAEDIVAQIVVQEIAAAEGEFQFSQGGVSWRRCAKSKEYIRAGDIFQVVISQRFSAKVQAEPFEIYRELRALNPSPYHVFICT